MENTTKALSPKMRAWLEVKDYLIIIIGMLMYGIGWTVFLVPNQLPLGAVPGIASIVYWGTGFPIQYTYLIVNAALLLLALKILGLRFCVKTICSVIALTVFLGVIQSLVKGNLVHEPFMACVIGASFCGGGIGLAFSANGSTGGTDIIAAIVHKYRDISLGRVLLITDLIIISSSYYEEIGKRINKDLHRGVTFIDGVGCYTHNNVKMMFVLAKRRESNTIFRLIKEIDPNAFVSQSAVIGVFGEGFDRIKVK